MNKTFKPKLVRTRPAKDDILKGLLENPFLAVRELNNRSFYEFLKFMWPAVSSETFQPNWHIKLLCDKLQALAEKVADQKSKSADKEHIGDHIYNVPPGTSKTTIVMIMFPAWCWTRWYWMKFIGLSYSNTLSLESAETCRDLIRSDRYQQIYPDLSIKQDKDQKGNFKLLKTFEKKDGRKPSTKHGGSRFSTSIGGSLTGFHGHIILVDDPLNPEQAVSPVQLESTNRWIDSTLPTRKIHKICSPIVMIMQRLHEDDPTGHQLEKKKKDVTHICLPGEIKNYENQVKPQELKKYYSDDGLLDSVRMGWSVLKDLEADLGQYGYAGQIGQSPTPPEGGMFEVGKLRVVDQMSQKHEIEQIIRYWDKAGTEAKQKSKAKGPAWSVGCKMAKLKDGKYLILNIDRGRWSTGDREKRIKDNAETDGREVEIGIEQEPGSGGKESAESTVRNLSGFKVHVDRPTGDKIYRADPLSVQVNWGNVLLLQGEWNKAFIEELRFFPHGTFKDQVDAASGAFKLLNQKKQASVW